MVKDDPYNDEEDLEDNDELYADEDEVLIDSTEKDFEQIFFSGNEVYFLESSGSWWKNTFKSNDDAKKVVDLFKKS